MSLFIDYKSDEDEETVDDRDKIRRYVQMKKTMTEGNDSQAVNEEGDEAQHTNAPECPSTDTWGGQAIDSGKVVSYESEYLDSLGPGSYDDTSEDQMQMMPRGTSLEITIMTPMSHWKTST